MQLVDLVVCSGRHTIGPITKGNCRSDESADDIPPTNLVLCSGIVVNHSGSSGSIQLLNAAGQPAGELAGDAYTHMTIENAVWGMYAWYRAPAGEKSFAPGRYSCRFSIENEINLIKSFTIAPA